MPAAGVPVPLVGRQRELALLDRFLDGTGDAGSPAPFLLLAGEPGLGKTHLLQAATQRAYGAAERHYRGVLERLAGQTQAAARVREKHSWRIPRGSRSRWRRRAGSPC